MENIFDNIMKNKYRALLPVIILAIILWSALTFQWFPGLILLIMTAVFAIAFRYLSTHGPETGEQKEWVMIIAGVIVGAIATALAPWLVWAVAFAVMFLLMLMLSRVEKRLSML